MRHPLNELWPMYPHVPCAHLLTYLPILNSKGLFIWREEDPSARKILEGGTNFGWVLYIQKFRSVWLPIRRGKTMAGDNNKNAIWTLAFS